MPYAIGALVVITNLTDCRAGGLLKFLLPLQPSVEGAVGQGDGIGGEVYVNCLDGAGGFPAGARQGAVRLGKAPVVFVLLGKNKTR